ncbi:MAG: hypothetical protein EA341_04985 [Mongoliibacter sp.]|uniref:Spy/CpxP family protein refolding chaperone n=1 Tax=Mongoliibacter sp. TaxID=2022438 RepID=UPI0012F43EE7|nr:hypothetical protein [Mongoliibacter sp.]TVP51611.1 MAG: hypothetical protein EA341_04985 [Mongoliibacter sp.]
MKKLITICLFFILSQGNAQDIFQKTLFSADLVMDNREFISLTDQQAEKIKKIHSQNAGEFRSLKWDLDNENEKLKRMLLANRIDQTIVQKQMDVVLALENKLKVKQLNTLVAIKNELTESQQEELNILRNNPSNERKLFGTVVKGSEKSVATSKGKEQGSKSGVSITSNIEGETIIIVRQDGKEKKFKRSDQMGIDQNSIETISVYKGSTAWEMYGEEGKNGVVVITLKKGAEFNFE